MTRSAAPGQQDVARLPLSFWVLTYASGLSKLGNTFLTLAVPWVLLQSDASPLLAGLGLAVQYAPYAVSPLLGALIDRFERRRVFIVSEVAQGVLVALLPVLIDHAGHGPTLACLAVIGVGNVVSNLTTDYSLVPALLEPEQLPRGYSRYGSITQVSRCLGPALAGVVIATWSADVALWIDAASFLATAVAAFLLPRRTDDVVADPLGTMLRSGWQGFRRTPRIPRLSLALGLYNVGAGALPALVAVAVQRGWEWSSWTAGLLLGAVAGGAALGAYLADTWWSGREVVDRVGPWFGVCVLAGVLVIVPWPPAAVVGLLLLGIGEGGMTVSTNAYRAQVVQPDLSGRVNALIRAVAMTAVLVSPVVINGAVDTFASTALWFAPVPLFALVAWAVWQLPRAPRSTRQAVSMA